MKDTQSFLMFVTGIVGRALGSGKYAEESMGETISGLTGAAVNAWNEHIEPLLPDTPSRAPAASGSPYRPRGGAPSGGGGFKRPFDLSKNWDMWKGDALKVGKKPSPLGKSWGECTWEEIADLVRQDDPDGISYLKYLLKTSDVNDPKWGAANAKRKQKCEYVLKTFGQQGEADVAEAIGDEETPF